MNQTLRRIAVIFVLLLLTGAAAPPPSLAAPGGGVTVTEAKININTASAEELTALLGIGPSYAQRIVEHREKNGPFKKVEDLLNVRGIGEKTFEKIRDRLTVGK